MQLVVLIDQTEVKNDILILSNLVTTSALNAKIDDVKKIPNITNLASTTFLTTVENKIPDHSKYIPTPEFNKLTAKKKLQQDQHKQI